MQPTGTPDTRGLGWTQLIHSSQVYGSCNYRIPESVPFNIPKVGISRAY